MVREKRLSGLWLFGAALLGACVGTQSPESGAGSKTVMPSGVSAAGYSLGLKDESSRKGDARFLVDEFESTLTSKWVKVEGAPPSEVAALHQMTDGHLTRLLGVHLTVSVPMTGGIVWMSAVAKCALPASSDEVKVEAQRDVPGGSSAASMQGELRRMADQLAVDLGQAVEHRLPSLSAETMAVRLREIEEAPIREALAAARNMHGTGADMEALARVDAAIKQAEDGKKKSLVDEGKALRGEVVNALTTSLLAHARDDEAKAALAAFVEAQKVAPESRKAEVEGARPAVIDKGIAGLNKALEQKAIDDAFDISAALEPIASDRSVDLQPLMGRLRALGKETAARLAKEAGECSEMEYQRAERLLRKALRLDPGNAEASGLLPTIEKANAELGPSYATNAHVTKDGDGLAVEFGLATKAQKLTVAEGKVRVRLVVQNAIGQGIRTLYDKSHEVAPKDFGQTKFSQMGVLAPRIEYAQVQAWGPRIGSSQFREMLIEQRLDVAAVIEFIPAGSTTPIKVSEKINPFTF